MNISISLRRSIFCVLTIFSPMHLPGFEGKSELIRFRQNSCEITYVMEGENQCRSPLDSNKLVTAGSTPRLFCGPDFPVDHACQGGFYARWTIRGNRLLLSSLEAYVYRLSNGGLLTNEAYSRLVSRMLTTNEIMKIIPGAFEWVNPKNYQVLKWNSKGEIFANWFTGEIQHSRARDSNNNILRFERGIHYTIRTPSGSITEPVLGQAAVSRVVEFDFSKTSYIGIIVPSNFYPDTAQYLKIEGSVLVEIAIDLEGFPTSAKIHSGPNFLHEAAKDYALTLRFKPPSKGVNGKVFNKTTIYRNLVFKISPS